MAYYNPDGTVNKEEFPKRVTVRFKTMEDFYEFCQKIDMKLSPNSPEIKYPLKNTLDDFFE